MKVSAKTEYACLAMLELAAHYGSGEPVRIRAIAEEFIGDSARKTIEKHFLHALDGIMSGSGEQAVDTMVEEFEKTASLLRGLAVTEQLRSRITEVRALA